MYRKNLLSETEKMNLFYVDYHQVNKNSFMNDITKNTKFNINTIWRIFLEKSKDFHCDTSLPTKY